jgi:hypothetical protein
MLRRESDSSLKFWAYEAKCWSGPENTVRKRSRKIRRKVKQFPAEAFNAND